MTVGFLWQRVDSAELLCHRWTSAEYFRMPIKANHDASLGQAQHPTARRTAQWALGLAMACLLAGCVGPYHYLRKEEAALPDGRSIEVVRWSKLDSRYDEVLDTWTQRPRVASYGISVPLARGGRADWEGDGTLMPIAVATDALNAYLATTPADCAAYAAVGSPTPPYVFFRYDGGRWQRIPAAAFPPAIIDANLLIPLDREAIDAIHLGPVSSETIRRINTRLDSDSRTINRRGPWTTWTSCLATTDDPARAQRLVY